MWPRLTGMQIPFGQQINRDNNRRQPGTRGQWDDRHHREDAIDAGQLATLLLGMGGQEVDEEAEALPRRHAMLEHHTADLPRQFYTFIHVADEAGVAARGHGAITASVLGSKTTAFPIFTALQCLDLGPRICRSSSTPAKHRAEPG